MLPTSGEILPRPIPNVIRTFFKVDDKNTEEPAAPGARDEVHAQCQDADKVLWTRVLGLLAVLSSAGARVYLALE